MQQRRSFDYRVRSLAILALAMGIGDSSDAWAQPAEGAEALTLPQPSEEQPLNVQVVEVPEPRSAPQLNLFGHVGLGGNSRRVASCCESNGNFRPSMGGGMQLLFPVASFMSLGVDALYRRAGVDAVDERWDMLHIGFVASVHFFRRVGAVGIDPFIQWGVGGVGAWNLPDPRSPQAGISLLGRVGVNIWFTDHFGLLLQGGYRGAWLPKIYETWQMPQGVVESGMSLRF